MKVVFFFYKEKLKYVLLEIEGKFCDLWDIRKEIFELFGWGFMVESNSSLKLSLFDCVRRFLKEDLEGGINGRGFLFFWGIVIGFF